MSSFWIQFVHGEPVSSRSLTELIKLKKEIEKQRKIKESINGAYQN